jgi:RNA polymerase sigma factor (sigma-70 family)
MIPTNNISVFVRYNDQDLRRIIADICSSFKFAEPVNDVVQDIYVKIVSSDIIQNYNRFFYRGRYSHTQMSTYLYPIIKNHILTEMQTTKYQHSKYRQELVDQDYDEVEDAENKEARRQLSTYEHTDEDSVDGLAFAFREFAERFKKSYLNETVGFERGESKPRKLLDVFHYMYMGYTNHQIAEIYGISDMSMSHTKAKLAKAMARFGLGTKIPQKKRNRKKVASLAG